MWSKRVFLNGLALLFLATPSAGSPLYHLWNQSFGVTGDTWAYEVATDGTGGMVLTGRFYGTTDFGGGPIAVTGSHLFVARYDRSGNHLWSASYGDGSVVYTQAAAIDDWGNVFVAGYFSGTVDFGGGVLTSAGGYDIFLVKFGPAGNHLWSKSFGDTQSDIVRDLVVDASGWVSICGYFQGDLDFGAGLHTSVGGYDCFVAGFDPSGLINWSRSAGSIAADYSFSMVADSDRNVIVSGYFYNTIDYGGGPLVSAGNADAFVAKFGQAGGHIWSRRYGSSAAEYNLGLALDPSGNLTIAGYYAGYPDFGGGPLPYAGGYDIYVAGLDADGNHRWSRGFGDGGLQYIARCDADDSGNVVVVGNFDSSVDFGGGVLTSINNDIYIARFDSSGNYLSASSFGSPDLHEAYNVATDPWGNVLMCGEYSGSLDFGGGLLTSSGSYDGYLVKFVAAPSIRDVRDIPGDQGGMVNVAWDACGVDNTFDHLITSYTLWRAIAPASVTNEVEKGARLIESAADIGENPGAVIREEKTAEGTVYYWYLVDGFSAYYLSGYSAPVPTLFDSTTTSPEMHYFQVIAHTADPYTFYTSSPAAGYSLDNLAPGAPQGLAGEQKVTPTGLQLSWLSNTEADLSHYAVYRGLNDLFVPGPGNRIGEPGDSTLFDPGWTWDSGYYYKVTAIDVHGNESEVALLGPTLVTGVGTTPVARGTWLGANYPNPFNPTTTISFGLAHAGVVRLSIHDAGGRLVRVLVDGDRTAGPHEIVWDGRDRNGQWAASGVYFVRMIAAGEIFTSKAVLLK